MLATVVIIILAAALTLVSFAAIGAILWMRRKEQAKDELTQRAETLTQLDDALNDGLMELNKVGNLIRKEIGEKYQAMLFLYNLLEEKQKNLPEDVTFSAVEHETEEKVEVVKAAVEAVALIEAFEEEATEAEVAMVNKVATNPVDLFTPVESIVFAENKAEVAAKPVARTLSNNPKHVMIRDMFDRGMDTAVIAKHMGVGQGEVILVLEMAGKR